MLQPSPWAARLAGFFCRSPAGRARPDLAGSRRERMAVVRREPFVTRAPNRVCAVLSPVTQRVDRGRKADRYAHAGVKHRGLADVDARHVEAFERVEARGQRTGAFTDEGARIRPFDAVPLGIRSLVEAREPLPTRPLAARSLLRSRGVSRELRKGADSAQAGRLNLAMCGSSPTRGSSFALDRLVDLYL